MRRGVTIGDRDHRQITHCLLCSYSQTLLSYVHFCDQSRDSVAIDTHYGCDAHTGGGPQVLPKSRCLEVGSRDFQTGGPSLHASSSVRDQDFSCSLSRHHSSAETRLGWRGGLPNVALTLPLRYYLFDLGCQIIFLRSLRTHPHCHASTCPCGWQVSVRGSSEAHSRSHSTSKPCRRPFWGRKERSGLVVCNNGRWRSDPLFFQLNARKLYLPNNTSVCDLLRHIYDTLASCRAYARLQSPHAFPSFFAQKGYLPRIRLRELRSNASICRSSFVREENWLKWRVIDLGAI